MKAKWCWVAVALVAVVVLLLLVGGGSDDSERQTPGVITIDGGGDPCEKWDYLHKDEGLYGQVWWITTRNVSTDKEIVPADCSTLHAWGSDGKVYSASLFTVDRNLNDFDTHWLLPGGTESYGIIFFVPSGVTLSNLCTYSYDEAWTVVEKIE